ncbi:hypothetical protein KA977_03795 [Candidatus Dependentiae bacterium]|nr:hypothetical protein [Candidatus Dependentiae bacterium]
MKLIIISIFIIIMFISINAGCGILIKKIGGNFNDNLKLSCEAEKLIEESFKTLDKINIVDCHNHILGISKETTGCYANENMNSFINPVKHFKYLIYLSASKVNKNSVDTEYIKRFNYLIKNFNHQGKYYIFAMDKYYEKNGIVNEKKTEFYTPNDYIYNLSVKNKNMIPVVSIHPYRKDALNELKKWADLNVKFIKWLPNSMGINPSDSEIIPFYAMMKKYNMILISHTGKEEAVDSEENQKLGNPLLLKLALDSGVKVIAAHCASSGSSIDFEDPEKKSIDNFSLFLRMMDKPEYKGLLFGDISAVTQYNHMDKCLNILLNRTDIHHRLINGSDYPLPGINFLIQTSKLCRNNFITKEEKKILDEIYKINPLMFDFILKRTIKSADKKNKFSDAVFINRFLNNS